MPDQVIHTDKYCPECGINLKGIDTHAHSLEHWPDYLDPAKSSKEARKRKALLDAGGVTKGEYLARLEVG